MTYLPLLLSLARFGSHLPPRVPDRRGGASGKVGTIPRVVRCVCPACNPAAHDPDDVGRHALRREIARTFIAPKGRRLTRAKRKALTEAKARREATSRAEFAAWMRGVAGGRSKS